MCGIATMPRRSPCSPRSIGWKERTSPPNAPNCSPSSHDLSPTPRSLPPRGRGAARGDAGLARSRCDACWLTWLRRSSTDTPPLRGFCRSPCCRRTKRSTSAPSRRRSLRSMARQARSRLGNRRARLRRRRPQCLNPPAIASLQRLLGPRRRAIDPASPCRARRERRRSHNANLYEWSRQYHWQDRIAELERDAAPPKMRSGSRPSARCVNARQRRPCCCSSAARSG